MYTVEATIRDELSVCVCDRQRDRERESGGSENKLLLETTYTDQKHTQKKPYTINNHTHTHTHIYPILTYTLIVNSNRSDHSNTQLQEGTQEHLYI